VSRYRDTWIRMSRWYTGPVIAGFVTITTVHVALLIADILNIRVRLIGAIVQIGLGLGIMAWSAWVVPVLMAKDHAVTFVKPPRSEARSLCASSWVPAGLALLFIAIITAGLILDAAHGYNAPLLSREVIVALTVLLAFVLANGVLAIRLGRVILRDTRGKAAALHICFACGYDLRDIASAACPECGEPIPSPPPNVA